MQPDYSHYLINQNVQFPLNQDIEVMGPKITVITVVLNAAKDLEETINSVVNQTYLNKEYIVIDGGSVDGTIDVIKKYNDKITYWISEKDNGIYHAMNKGILLAKGEYIHFLNAGDTYYDKTTLSQIANYLVSDIVYGRTVYKTKYGYYLAKYSTSLNTNVIKYGMVVTHQSIFYKKKIFEQNGFYDLHYKFLADWEHLIRVLKCNPTVNFTNIIHVVYLEEGFNSSHWCSSILEFFAIQKKYNDRIWAYYMLMRKILRKLFSLIIPSLIKFKFKQLSWFE